MTGSREFEALFAAMQERARKSVDTPNVARQPVRRVIDGSCRHGHPRTIKSTYFSIRGEIVCRICGAASKKRRREGV